MVFLPFTSRLFSVPTHTYTLTRQFQRYLIQTFSNYQKGKLKEFLISFVSMTLVAMGKFLGGEGGSISMKGGCLNFLWWLDATRCRHSKFREVCYRHSGLRTNDPIRLRITSFLPRIGWICKILDLNTTIWWHIIYTEWNFFSSFYFFEVIKWDHKKFQWYKPKNYLGINIPQKQRDKVRGTYYHSGHDHPLIVMW